MFPLTNTFDINEGLFMAIESGSYENVLKYLMEGARATKISTSCGRTAVGQASLLGDAEILELLLQSCEEPDMDLFRNSSSCHFNHLTEMEIDTTPDGMDKLEWDDEFNCDYEDNSLCIDDSDDCTSLYLYYAKTFERTGHILINLEENNVASHIRSQDPHTIDALSMAPIHYAAACGHVDCLRILIAHGAQVNVATGDGLTPLHAAAENEEVVRLLLKHKANPNKKTFSTGETPLHAAIRHRNYAVINQLLLSAVNINETNNQEQTPLMSAIANELDDIAIRLIDLGAKLNIEDSYRNTALHLAVIQNNINIASYLLVKGARLIISHFLLHHCVKHNYVRMAELLIDHGESLNVRDISGMTAIGLAIMYNNAEMLECLLKAAKIQRQQGKHVEHLENALLMAIQHATNRNQFQPIMRILIAYDNKVEINSLSGGGAISGTMTSSTTCCVPYCATPLSRAIMLFKMDIAELLIKEGADISQICREHVVNTLRLANHKGFVTLAILMVHAGFKFPTLGADVVFKSNWRQIRLHLETWMRRLNRTPLSLQSLTRIKIRQLLINNLNTSPTKRAMATKQESALYYVIRNLDVPKPLQKFLSDFDDLPRVN